MVMDSEEAGKYAYAGRSLVAFVTGLTVIERCEK
jgi:hypothetical protein